MTTMIRLITAVGIVLAIIALVYEAPEWPRPQTPPWIRQFFNRD